MPLYQPAITRFGSGEDIYVKQAQGQTDPAVVTGALEVEGTITSDNYAVISANTNRPIRIQGDANSNDSVVRVSAVASGKNLIVGNTNNASGSEFKLADSQITSNKPLFSLTPTPASSTAGGTADAGIQVTIDMTGLDAGIYDAIGSATYSPGDTSVYDVSCPIYWDGTTVIGGGLGFVVLANSSSVVTGLLAGSPTTVKYAVINAGDVTPRFFTLSLFQRTVDVY